MTTEALLQTLNGYFSPRSDVTIAILYGSFAKGTQHDRSDVDIAVHTASPLSIQRLADMQLELDALCRREIDLVDLRAAEGIFLHQIMTTGTRIKYEENQYVYYQLKALYFYEDFLPILRSCQEERIRRFINGQ